MARTLHAYFEEAAARHPGAPALGLAGRMWSYGEVRVAADRICESIRAQGLAGAGETIGLLCDKGLAAYAGLLAILKSGNVYVPLNSRNPLERLAKTIALARMRALVIDRSHVDTTVKLLARPDVAVSVLVADTEHLPDALAAINDGARTRSRSHVPAGTETETAYVMFTSGSTGVPKGVPVTHANATACIEAVCSYLEFLESDRFTQFSDLTFDVSIGEIFLCWKSAGCLLIPSFADKLQPLDFANRWSATVWSSVPTLAHNVNELGRLRPGALPSLRHTLFCGEALPSRLARAWQAAAPSSTVVNLYGPTETTIFATLYVCPRDGAWDSATVPLGLPMTGFEYRIDRDQTASESGHEMGELWLAGPQVVSGYWHNEAATAASFVTMPAGGEERTWYRTGDVVSLDPRYGLLFHGRRDQQTKVKGYRVELHEVENILERITGSGLVAVVPVRAADGRCEALVAFVQGITAGEEEIRDLCRVHLPDYMLPRRIVTRPTFPVNSNGKIDYVTLSAEATVLLHGSSAPEAVVNE